MTQAILGGWTLLPAPHSLPSSDGNTAVDATTDYVAFVTRAPRTGTIDKAYVRLGTTTLSGTLSCQIQTLDSSGDPSGSAYGSSAQSDVAVTGTEDNSWITFSSLACSATAGDYICIRIWASTVTSGSANIITTAPGTGPENPGFPYSTVRTTGTGAGTHAAIATGAVLEYSGAVFYPLGWSPSASVATENIDSDGSVRRLGNRFILPVPVTAIGVWVMIDNDTDTTSLKIYGTDGTTVLATATLVAANRQASSARPFYALFDSGTEVVLSANTASAYRVVAETNNTSATAAGFPVLTFSALGWQDLLSLGQNCYHTSHNGTSWTDTTTKRVGIGLIVSKIDDGTGFGAASFNLGIV